MKFATQLALAGPHSCKIFACLLGLENFHVRVPGRPARALGFCAAFGSGPGPRVAPQRGLAAGICPSRARAFARLRPDGSYFVALTFCQKWSSLCVRNRELLELIKDRLDALGGARHVASGGWHQASSRPHRAKGRDSTGRRPARWESHAPNHPEQPQPGPKGPTKISDKPWWLESDRFII